MVLHAEKVSYGEFGEFCEAVLLVSSSVNNLCVHVGYLILNIENVLSAARTFLLPKCKRCFGGASGSVRRIASAALFLDRNR